MDIKLDSLLLENNEDISEKNTREEYLKKVEQDFYDGFKINDNFSGEDVKAVIVFLTDHTQKTFSFFVIFFYFFHTQKISSFFCHFLKMSKKDKKMTIFFTF